MLVQLSACDAATILSTAEYTVGTRQTMQGIRIMFLAHCGQSLLSSPGHRQTQQVPTLHSRDKTDGPLLKLMQTEGKRDIMSHRQKKSLQPSPWTGPVLWRQ